MGLTISEMRLFGGIIQHHERKKILVRDTTLFSDIVKQIIIILMKIVSISEPTAPRGYEKEKYYDSRGKIMDDVWKINMLGQNDKTERVGYATQKPKELLYKIVDSSCPVGGIVADFFCGSGTTLVTAKELGRNYIGCDIGEKRLKLQKID